MTKKQIYVLTALSLLTILSGLHKYFEGMGRINPFLFYEYRNSCGDIGISVSIFVYELSYMIEILILLSVARYLAVRKIVRNIISPFMWIAFIDILDYICVCKQLSYYKLPLLFVLIFIYTYRWENLSKKWTDK